MIQEEIRKRIPVYGTALRFGPACYLISTSSRAVRRGVRALTKYVASAGEGLGYFTDETASACHADTAGWTSP